MGVRKLARTLALLAAPPLGVGYVFESIVRRNVFYSGPHERGVPEATGVPFEEVTFWAADSQPLTGWLFEGGDLPITVLFMHGTSYNASDMWATEERARLFGGFVRGLGCRFFVFDYRGYGPNGGTPTEPNAYLDAEGALAYLHNRKEIDAMRIVLYGFSLGTGVAVELALRDPCAGLILRAPFTSIPDLIRGRYARMRLPLSLMPWLPFTRFDSAAKIGHIHVPLLIMHGDADETVPFAMGRRLFELAPEPKRFVPFPGAGHADFPLDLMVPAVRDFLEAAAAAAIAS